MRILNGTVPQQAPNGQQPPPQAAAVHAPAAAAPPVAPAPAVYYEYRDPLLSASAPAPAVPAAAQPVREEPRVEKKHEKPVASPLGRRTRAARDVNSDDERLQRPQPNTEETLSSLLKRKGYEIRRMAEDGNCLFRCVFGGVWNISNLICTSQGYRRPSVRRPRDARCGSEERYGLHRTSFCNSIA